MISLFGKCIGMTVVIVNHRIMFFGTPGEISTGNMLCARNAGGQENVAGQTDISITCCVCWAIAFFFDVWFVFVFVYSIFTIHLELSLLFTAFFDICNVCWAFISGHRLKNGRNLCK